MIWGDRAASAQSTADGECKPGSLRWKTETGTSGYRGGNEIPRRSQDIETDADKHAPLLRQTRQEQNHDPRDAPGNGDNRMARANQKPGPEKITA